MTPSGGLIRVKRLSNVDVQHRVAPTSQYIVIVDNQPQEPISIPSHDLNYSPAQARIDQSHRSGSALQT